MNNLKQLPTFIYIGSAKTGSTWIFKALKAHPEVYVALGKELHFFDQHYHRGLSWYASFFAKANEGVKARGELTPGYLYFRETAERIAQDLPNVKLLACIRNPIDRALSAYQFQKRNGIAESDFVSTMHKYPEILERGKYFNYVKMYLDIFGAENFKVFIHDDLKKDAVLFAKQLYQFIGVDAEYEYADAKKKVLEASEPRAAWLAALTYKMLLSIHKKMGWLGLIGKMRHPFIMRLLYKPINKDKKEQLTDEQKAWLRDYYAEDVEKLGKLLNRNLQHWL